MGCGVQQMVNRDTCPTPCTALLPSNACICYSYPPRIKDIDATAQLILDLLELCQALLHLLVQLHAAGSVGLTVLACCTAVTTCTVGTGCSDICFRRNDLYPTSVISFSSENFRNAARERVKNAAARPVNLPAPLASPGSSFGPVSRKEVGCTVSSR